MATPPTFCFLEQRAFSEHGTAQNRASSNVQVAACQQLAMADVPLWRPYDKAGGQLLRRQGGSTRGSECVVRRLIARPMAAQLAEAVEAAQLFCNMRRQRMLGKNTWRTHCAGPGSGCDFG